MVGIERPAPASSATRCGPPTKPSCASSTTFSARPTPISRRCCARSCGGASTRYEGSSARAGALDFVDLLLRARDLLRTHAQVRRDFQSRFTHLFVDEFQDTDPLQAEILLLLAADDPEERDWHRVKPVPGKLFLVGDPKQSIYRFRRADVEIYQEVCDLLEARGAGARTCARASARRPTSSAWSMRPSRV